VVQQNSAKTSSSNSSSLACYPVAGSSKSSLLGICSYYCMGLQQLLRQLHQQVLTLLVVMGFVALVKMLSALVLMVAPAVALGEGRGAALHQPAHHQKQVYQELLLLQGLLLLRLHLLLHLPVEFSAAVILWL
jgi:hypothetical protein